MWFTKQILEEASPNPTRNTSAASHTALGWGLRAGCPAGLVGSARSQNRTEGRREAAVHSSRSPAHSPQRASGSLDVPVREAPGQAFLGPRFKGLGPRKHGGKVH